MLVPMRASSLIAAVAITAAMSLCRPAAAADRSILVLVPSAEDDRIEPVREAVAFWNDRLDELGVDTRLAAPRLVVASPVARAVENYARSVAQRGVRLPGGEAEPNAPEELHFAGTSIFLEIACVRSWENPMKTPILGNYCIGITNNLILCQLKTMWLSYANLKI